ncbi:phosphatidate cytidylyltransferase [Mucilaginibacter sp. PPCGB 2223]|uniref:phosphatidate cytidylyltransferase n=1 Tax=Mucilaginibacter sp. PPCGB 2223 TaxID=1886027 RepID=UPI000826097C|nr:phosphatidate cytidylyltransferase [Mucilaginibacter sp. PPCGB 2223]OCX54837.1 phosphatidate cytidylyltransferase [Mucilaginibacter sp. PPCGB 2223]
MKRTITGAVLVLVILCAVVWNIYSFVALAVAINILCLTEFYRLLQSKTFLPQKVNGIALSVLILIASAMAFYQQNLKFVLINIPAVFGVFVAELYRKASHPFYNLALTFLGIFCITVPLCLLVGVALLPTGRMFYHADIVLGCFILIWTSDTSAYLIGRSFGEHALFKRISPGKTWEGSIGAFLSVTYMAYFISCYFKSLSAGMWLIVAMIVLIAGTYGDLIKSMMKRSLGVKDSGTLLPGHGGMLDRFDSLLGSVPFILGYLLLFYEA